MKVHFNQIQSSVIDVKEDKRNECYNFGKDNAFPSLVNAVASLSVTTKACIDRVSKAIYGDGLGVNGKLMANKTQTFNELFRVCAREFAKHSNVFLHISFDGNKKPKYINMIPSSHVRIGKGDDTGYSGKFLVYDNWDKTKGKKIMSEKFVKIDKMNLSESVVNGQVQSCKGETLEDKLSNYNGQMLHIFKDSTYVYGMTDLESALNDAVAEAAASEFRRRGGEVGFLNNKVVAVPEFTDKEDRKKFKVTIDSLRGSKESGGIVLVEVPADITDVTKAMYVGDLTSSYDDKIFEYSEAKAEKNIAKAFLVSQILIAQNETAFANSGALLYEAKKQLFDDKEEERMQLMQAFNTICKSMEKSLVLKVESPYEQEEAEAEVEDVNAKAQANLRGSVGGVQALATSIIAPIAMGQMTVDQGRAIAKNLYGFTQEEVEEMIVEPVNKNNNV